MKNISHSLYEVNKHVKCLKCGNKGAVKFYGKYYPTGIKDKTNKFLQKYENSPYMSRAIGFGGTIPWECVNCGNKGLIDNKCLEGYEKAFESIKED